MWVLANVLNEKKWNDQQSETDVARYLAVFTQIY